MSVIDTCFPKRRGAEDAAIPLPDDAVAARIRSVDYTYIIVYAVDGRGALLAEIGSGYEEMSAEDFAKRRVFDYGVRDDHFPHDLDLAELSGLAAAEREARIAEYFFAHVNREHLSDPILRSHDELGDGETGNGVVTFTRGSEEELERLLRLFVHTDPQLGAEPVEVQINTGYDDDEAQLARYSSFHTERLEQLVSVALTYHTPYGGEWHYNDGAEDRISGYSPYTCSRHYSIDPPTAHEKLDAMNALQEWIDGLPEHNRRSLAQIRAALDA